MELPADPLKPIPLLAPVRRITFFSIFISCLMGLFPVYDAKLAIFIQSIAISKNNKQQKSLPTPSLACQKLGCYSYRCSYFLSRHPIQRISAVALLIEKDGNKKFPSVYLHFQPETRNIFIFFFISRCPQPQGFHHRDFALLIGAEYAYKPQQKGEKTNRLLFHPFALSIH